MNAAHTKLSALLLPLLTLIPGAPLQAQTIIPITPSVAAAAAEPSEGSKAGRYASNISSALSSGLPLIKRGPFSVRPHFLYRFLYASGIQAGLGNPRDTTIQTVEPAVLLEIGQFWKLDYVPTFTFYSDRAFTNNVDHSVGLTGNKSYNKASVGFSQGYESRHLLLIETGHQTRQELIVTSFNASYRLGPRTSLEASVSRSARYAAAVTDAPEWTTSDWLQYTTAEWIRYTISPKLNVSAGVSIGYSDISIGENMLFTTPQVRIAWQPTDKISVSAQGGLEDRAFRNSPRENLRNPVYSAMLGYQLFNTTKLSIDFSRAVSASYFANEITKSQSWSAAAEQRLLSRLYLSVQLSVRSTDYLPTNIQSPPRRADNSRFISTRLSTALFGRATVSVLYQNGHNSSDDDLYEFRTEQAGIEFSYAF